MFEKSNLFMKCVYSELSLMLMVSILSLLIYGFLWTKVYELLLTYLLLNRENFLQLIKIFKNQNIPEN